VRQNRNALCYAHEDLKKDKDFLLALESIVNPLNTSGT